MKWIIYNLLFAAVYPFLLPGFLLRMLRRGGYAARMGDRFALYPEGLFGKGRALFDSHKGLTANSQQLTANFIWIHAVSVGEVQVAGQLMREWRKVDPGVRFCFSTTSSTGWKIAEKELASLASTSSTFPTSSTSQDILIYNPLDFPNFVKSALRTVRPRAIVLTESEIWPNFILQAKKMGIPLFLINARVSDRSAPRYKAAKWFFGEVLSCFTRIFAQSDLDKARLVAAGAPEAKVEVTGSFKFDVAHRNEAKERELREWIRAGIRDQGSGFCWGGLLGREKTRFYSKSTKDFFPVPGSIIPDPFSSSSLRGTSRRPTRSRRISGSTASPVFGEAVMSRSRESKLNRGMRNSIVRLRLKTSAVRQFTWPIPRAS